MLQRRSSHRGFCCAMRRRAERQPAPVRRASDHQSATCREARRMTRALLRSGASRMPASRMTNSFREIRFRIFSKRIRGVAVTQGERGRSGAVFPCRSPPRGRTSPDVGAPHTTPNRSCKVRLLVTSASRLLFCQVGDFLSSRKALELDLFPLGRDFSSEHGGGDFRLD